MTIYAPEVQSLIKSTLDRWFKFGPREFKPTYLYIKRHTITNMLYFGCSIRSHEKMISYKGSGGRWKDHIKIHGKDHVETLWYCLFYDPFSIVEFAVMFSIQENIIKSDKWANRIYETVLSVNSIDKIMSDETKLKLRNINEGRIMSDETKHKISISSTGRTTSDMTKQLQSKRALKRSELNMCYMQSEIGKNNMSKRKSGKGSSTARIYEITNPFGEKYIVHGELKNFCIKHNISYDMMKRFIDKNTSIPSVNSKFCNINNKPELLLIRQNTTGWNIRTV